MAAGREGAVAGVCWPTALVEAFAGEPDAGAVELWFGALTSTEPDVSPLPEGEVMVVGHTGGKGGGEDVWVGAVGDVTGAEARVVAPGVTGPDDGALPVGDVTGVDPPGADVGVVGAGAGALGDPTGVGDPVVGAEVGFVGGAGAGAGVGAGAGGCVAAVAGTRSKTNALPFPSTATHDASETHETALRLPKRSSRVGVDHPEPLEVT